MFALTNVIQPVQILAEPCDRYDEGGAREQAEQCQDAYDLPRPHIELTARSCRLLPNRYETSDTWRIVERRSWERAVGDGRRWERRLAGTGGRPASPLPGLGRDVSRDARHR